MDTLFKKTVEQTRTAISSGKRDELRREKQKQWEESRTKANKMAIEDMTKDYKNTIKTASEAGYWKTEIMRFKKSDNIQYNDFYLSDLLRKGTLLQDLRSFYYPFNVYYTRISHDTGKETDAVFVSWGDNKEKEEEKGGRD